MYNKVTCAKLTRVICENRFSSKDEFAEIVVGFGGRVEQLYLRSLSTGVMRNVLLSHHGDADLMAENKFWKGMLLIPWANRIDHVRCLGRNR